MNIFQKVTLKNLKENRTRTLVTIIGIILSAAMFTAVTVSISSLRHYLISHTIYNHGSWYGAAYDLTLQNADSISDDEEISDSVRMNRLGYAWLSDSVNENKPYLCVYGIDEKFTDLMPVHLTEGRMPQNNNEILLPEHLAANGGIHYQLDDTLSLELGTRVSSDGETLGNHNPYYPEENYDERLENKKSYTYTVVGFYERPDFEDYSAPGYTALTISDLTGEGVYDLYFRTTDGAEIVNYIDTHISPIMEYKDDFEISYTMNYDLLRLYGYSGESSYNLVMFNLAVILIIIIAFGSISLIYNAFSISVSERTKQFGLLSSIGATRHQLTGSVLFEAFFLSIIGIPLGLLSGTVGIGVTFYFISDMITGYLFSDTTTSLTLHASLPALATAVCISLITILISAWLPARRAMKGSAIDAIRQTKDITIRAGKLKTSPLAYRLFGFEGMLAAKNYKRNKRKYRATVISLFLSIVLFISTSSFCAYLMKSADDILVTQGYDISYSLLADTDISPEDLEEELSGVSGVSFSSYYTFMTLGGMVNSASLSEDYFNYNASFTLDGTYAFAKSDEVYSYFNLYFVKDDVFRDYLKENRLSEDDYFNSASPKAVMVDTMHTYYKDRYHTFSMFDSCEDGDITLYLPRTSEELSYTGFGYDIDGNVFYRYNQNSPEGEVLNYTELPLKKCSQALPVNVGAILSTPPENTGFSTYDPNLYFPYSMIDSVFSVLEEGVDYIDFPSGLPASEHLNAKLTFDAKDHAKVTERLGETLSGLNLPPEQLTDYAVGADQDRALMTVVNIFSYGFIILISLIAAANVFNTISTNIILRKREFAMLRSIGLSPDGFKKMMNLECLLYGFKGLLYGLPVSIFITWQIYRAISYGLEMNFFIPWYSIAIAVGSVFLVVFSTMLYSTHKINKENIMDTLKDENI